MANPPNSNYVEDEEGFHKKADSTAKGSSPFNRPLRTANSLNRSLFERPDGTTDWNAWDKAVQQERGDGS